MEFLKDFFDRRPIQIVKTEQKHRFPGLEKPPEIRRHMPSNETNIRHVSRVKNMFNLLAQWSRILQLRFSRIHFGCMQQLDADTKTATPTLMSWEPKW